MPDLITIALSSAAVTALLIAALGLIARSWLLERLKQSIAHEYARRLEEFKTVLAAENARSLEQLRAQNSQQQALQSVATSALVGVHVGSMARRLDAIQKLWSETIKWRLKAPPFLSFVDAMPHEYLAKAAFENETLQFAFRDLPMGVFSKDMLDDGAEVEPTRPFAGEFLFVLFLVYRQFTSWVALHYANGFKAEAFTPWYDEPGLKKVLQSVLEPREIEHVNGIPVHKIRTVQDMIEQKMMSHVGKLLSGEASATSGLDAARKIAAAVTQFAGNGA